MSLREEIFKKINGIAYELFGTKEIKTTEYIDIVVYNYADSNSNRARNNYNGYS